MTTDLLTRDEFRKAVFARDGDRCVVCPSPAQDAHHIIERRLWPDGGYYLDNGASLCGVHHVEAERTTLSADDIRTAAKISAVRLPPHLYRDQPYDKWGNPILPNGTRLRGELFHDESVQKVLAPVLHLFTHHVKYPRTYHLPWSPGLTKDDRAMADDLSFRLQDVVVTLKMDGENTTMYRDFIHARSLSHEPHPSRNYVKAIHGAIAHEIPDGWRICGENLAAKHSIRYEGLPGYFMVFGVWDERNVCLPWDQTVEWAQLLDLPTVPVLFRGMYHPEDIRGVFRPYESSHEGYVIRLAGSFPCSEFRRCVGKYVRKDHVQTHGHWMRQAVEFNGLAGKG